MGLWQMGWKEQDVVGGHLGWEEGPAWETGVRVCMLVEAQMVFGGHEGGC